MAIDPNAIGRRLAAPITRARQDPLGQLEQAIYSGRKIPVTSAKHTFSLTIRVKPSGGAIGGTTIGAITNLSPSQSLEIEDEYEIDANASGLPNHIVAQNLRGRTLNLSKYELWKNPIARVFGFSDVIPLLTQQIPFFIEKTWEAPLTNAVDNLFPTQGVTSTQIEQFGPCLFTQMGHTVSVEDRVVGVNATIIWTKWSK